MSALRRRGRFARQADIPNPASRCGAGGFAEVHVRGGHRVFLSDRSRGTSRRPAADTGHYEMWQTDLKLVRELGLRYLRYGPPIYRIWKGPGEYDWSFLDPVMREMRRLGIVPIIDLVHFGLPDWLGDFQNPDWPDHFADYAHALRRALSVGAVLHAGERDLRDRAVQRGVRLVERAADERPRRSSPTSSTA